MATALSKPRNAENKPPEKGRTIVVNKKLKIGSGNGRQVMNLTVVVDGEKVTVRRVPKPSRVAGRERLEIARGGSMHRSQDTGGAAAPGAVQTEANRGSFDPIAAGRRAVAQMQEAEGGAWTGLELKDLFGLTAATLHKRRAEHRIVYWRDPTNRFHYPKWQFNDAGALLAGVQEALQTLQSSDEWRIMRYFLAPRRQLGDRTPLDLLRSGEVEKVAAHAKAHGEENTW